MLNQKIVKVYIDNQRKYLRSLRKKYQKYNSIEYFREIVEEEASDLIESFYDSSKHELDEAQMYESIKLLLTSNLTLRELFNENNKSV